MAAAAPTFEATIEAAARAVHLSEDRAAARAVAAATHISEAAVEAGTRAVIAAAHASVAAVEAATRAVVVVAAATHAVEARQGNRSRGCSRSSHHTHHTLRRASGGAQRLAASTS